MRSAEDRPRVAATIGVFDGVHLGHQEVLRRVIVSARDMNGLAVVVTFSRHPLAVLNPPSCPVPLTTVEERRALLLAQGIDEVLVLDFDLEMAKKTAREFLESVLLNRYQLKLLVVGPDFAMGKGRQGDVEALLDLDKELGFLLEVLVPVHGRGGAISSTRLRQALAAGQVDSVREWLGRDYALTGTVVPGHGRGRELGFPTANLEIEEPVMIPGDGVYAAQCRVLGPEESGASVLSSMSWRSAVVNVGLAPTFGEGKRRIEVHLLDANEDFRGLRIAIRFVARLRGEVRFPDVGALKAQITADIAAARAMLAEPARTPA